MRRMGMPVQGDLLAVYGELLSGLDAHEPAELGGQALRKGLVLKGSCWIPGVLYDLGPYPALAPGRGEVLGELYEVSDPSLFEELDWFETYDRGWQTEPEYVRRLIPLIEPEVEAWVYVYARDPGNSPRIESGDWRGHLGDRMRPG
jgi:gamma-glutamylcyclotransferase (GGCT)/AIG2-like uncharacterized protein YtfP